MAGDVEAVGVVAARRDGELGDEGGTIGPAAPELSDAMLVNGQAVLQLVDDVDGHRVTGGDIER